MMIHDVPEISFLLLLNDNFGCWMMSGAALAVPGLIYVMRKRAIEKQHRKKKARHGRAGAAVRPGFPVICDRWKVYPEKAEPALKEVVTEEPPGAKRRFLQSSSAAIENGDQHILVDPCQ